MLEVEKAARTLDMPLSRRWRHYWSNTTAAKKSQAFTWVVLGKADMYALFDSRVRHMRGEKATVQLLAEAKLTYDRRGMAAVLFWHNLDGSDVLLAGAWDGLQSVADNGGFSSVELYSYQRFRRLPPGVIAQPAEGVLPYEMFKEYVRGVSAVLGDKAIAPVADLVRLKACVCGDRTCVRCHDRLRHYLV